MASVQDALNSACVWGYRTIVCVTEYRFVCKLPKVETKQGIRIDSAFMRGSIN